MGCHWILTEVGELIIPHIWRFSISAARVVVALSFLVIYYLSIRSLVQLPGLIFLTYFLYSVASLWWRPLPGKWGAITIAVAAQSLIRRITSRAVIHRR